MKKIVDQKALSGDDNNGMYWLTGSQKFKMMKDVSEYLAGRIAVFDMSSLSTAEIEGRECFYTDYINTYLERDIKELSLAGKLGEFYDFWYLWQPELQWN